MGQVGCAKEDPTDHDHEQQVDVAQEGRPRFEEAPESKALAYSVVVNVVSFFVVISMGLPVLPFLSVRLTDLARKGEEAVPEKA